MLGILALIFTLWCAYEWGRSSQQKQKELDEMKEKINRYENRENHRL